MRWLGRLMLLMIIAGGIAVGAKTYLPNLYLWSLSFSSSIEDARASSFFILSDERWLEFPVSPNDDYYRFYLHAALVGDSDSLTHDTKANFNIAYQWRDSKGSVISEFNYAMAVRPSTRILLTDENGVDYTAPRRFYGVANAQPSMDQSLYLSTKGRNASVLAFKLVAADPLVSQVGIRSYKKQYRDPNELNVTWQRMSQERRDKLSEASIYPSFLISDFERNNLLKSYWAPMGPKGVIDKDFFLSTLYIYDMKGNPASEQEVLPEGHYASPINAFTTIIETTGTYKIHWQPYRQYSRPQLADYDWQGQDYTQNINQQLQFNGQGEWVGEIDKGLIQLIPDRPGVLLLYRMESGKWTDVTPENRTAKAFLCDASRNLRYDMTPGVELQPLRIVARAIQRPDIENSSLKKPTLRVLATNLRGKRRYEKDKNLFLAPDIYRQFKDAKSVGGSIYLPLDHYINLAPDAAYLELACSQPTLISVYNRPYLLPVKRQLPRDKNPWMSYGERLPVWFGLEPQKADQLRLSGRVKFINWYFKPVQLNESIQSGEYEWDWLDTHGDSITIEKQLFTQYETDSLKRREVREAAYSHIPWNADSQIASAIMNFEGNYKQRLLSPKLVYVREQTNPEKVQVRVDGQLTSEATIIGKAGILRLPALTRGVHEISVSAPKDIAWYVNQTLLKDQSHMTRSAYFSPSGSIEFSVPLSGKNQSLSIWVYSPISDKTTLGCSLMLKAKQYEAVDGFRSLPLYSYQFSDLNGPIAHVLQHKSVAYTGPYVLTMSLKNLPKQRAGLELNCDSPELLISAGVISEGAVSYSDFREVVEHD